MYHATIYPLVIIEWELADFDGGSICRSMRDNPGSEYTTFVMLTGSARRATIEGALRIGVDEYLTTAIPEELLDLRLRLTEQQARNRVNRLIAERTLRESESRYRMLFEDSKDMVYATLPDGTITDINSAGVDLLGWQNREELVGINIRTLYDSIEDRAYYDKQMKLLSYVKDFELVLRRSDGTRIIVLETSTAIREENGDAIEYRGIIKDITERIRAEKDQMRLNVQLTESNQKLKLTQSRLVQQEKLASIGQLAAGVAHEINNPLGFIKSNFGTLERYMNQLSSFLNGLHELRSGIVEQLEREFHVSESMEDSSAIFRESQEGFDRIISIIRGLRTFARSDAEEIDSQYDLNAAIENALTMTRNEWKYVATVEQDLGHIPRIECAANAINQVLLNLILNAGQALKNDERDRPKLISIRSWSENDSVYCEIQDNGPGISEQNIPRIFDPFFTTKPMGQGTGLGLSISFDTIVNRHSGDIFVNSTEGEGARFTVRLPRTFTR
jgi:PAS domain S-box-containing protein